MHIQQRTENNQMYSLIGIRMSINELTQIIFYMELTHLGSESPVYNLFNVKLKITGYAI